MTDPFLTIDLQSYTPVTIVLVGFAVTVAAAEAGIRLGLYAHSRGHRWPASTFESAILGLLALMIGFTFAMALSRYDARRDAITSEANTIGTAALRARLLPAPDAEKSLTLLNAYVHVRLDVARTILTPDTLNAAIARSNEIQESLWQQAMALARTDNGMVPVGLYIQSLNEMIDAQGRRLVALRNRIPNSVIVELYLITIVAMGFSGYAAGLEIQRGRLHLYVVAALVSYVILLLIDLDRPNAGFIATSLQPLIDTANSMAAYGR